MIGAYKRTGMVSAFGHFPVALGGWAVGAAAALGFGRQFIAVRGAAWSQQAGMLHVPGSWLPLALILGLFAIKYGAGASLALHPELSTHVAFAGLISLAYGMFSGLFLARGLSLRNLAKRPAGVLAA